MENINTILEKNNLNLTRSPGDGHCLLYSTVTSWNSQYHNHANIIKPWLMQAIESDFKENQSKYIGFLSYLNPEEISEQWDLYLRYKRYNLDIDPRIISNVLKVTLQIIDENTKNLCKLINVHPDSADQHGILIVHRFGDHYNGTTSRSTVTSSIISPPHVKEPRRKYTAEQLKNFAVYPPHISRNIRKCLIKHQIWRPTGSTRKVHNSNVKFALLNAQSARNKTTLLINDYITSSGIDIACITETWLSNDDAADINILQDNGYQLSHIPRAKGRGGGVGVLYKSSLKLISVKPIHHVDFEAMNITLKQSNQHVLHIILLYRPPTFSANLFLEPFNNMLQEASVLGEHVIISGDFNIHYNNERCKVACNLAQLIDQCGFQQSVQSPTHARGNTLDLIIAQLRSNILVSKPRITVQISDHFVVECYVNFKKPRSHTHTLTYRKYRSIDSERFSSDLLSATQYVDTITDFNTSV